MHPVEIESCLSSMEILIDTREQPSERAERRYKSFGSPYRRQVLDYGDYTYNFTLPNGKKLFGDSETVKGHAVIERKMDLVELSGCLCQTRDRFEREFQRARENNASVYLMVEDANWENLILGRYKTRFNPNAFEASILAFIARYDIKPIFCKKETSGKLIRDILFRELKERLERGIYDL